MKCTFCNGTSFVPLETYKHIWHQCNHCGTVIRRKRDRLPLDNFLTRRLIRSTPLDRLYGKTILNDPAIVEDVDFYHYYKDTVKAGVRGTKWELVNKRILDQFDELGIDVKGKRVLDISGGPGFLSQAIKMAGGFPILTEFSEQACKGMEEVLNIEARKFDYNSDKISEVISADEDVDVIIILYSIGFCDRLADFFADLRKICRPGTDLYVTNSPPTLGLFLRWQFDEYVYTTLHNEASFLQAVNFGGWEMLDRVVGRKKQYDEGWFKFSLSSPGAFLNGLHRPIVEHYRRKISKRAKSQRLDQYNIAYHYKAI